MRHLHLFAALLTVAAMPPGELHSLVMHPPKGKGHGKVVPPKQKVTKKYHRRRR